MDGRRWTSLTSTVLTLYTTALPAAAQGQGNARRVAVRPPAVRDAVMTPAVPSTHAGKVALVTGANSGMGFETARKLAENGAKVCVSGGRSS